MHVAAPGAVSAPPAAQVAKTPTPPPPPPPPAPAVSNDGDGDSDKGGIDIRV